MHANNNHADELPRQWLDQGVESYEKGNLEEAIKSFTYAASLGYAEACNYLYLIYSTEREFFNENLSRAYKAQYLFRLRCLSEQGDRDAMFSLAKITYFGEENISPDRKSAIETISRLAESDHLEAQLYLVEMYRDGMDEMPADQMRAEYWLRRYEILLKEGDGARTT